MRGLLTLLTLSATALASIGSTGASFSAIQNNGGNQYDAKADWVAPTVSMTDPGANLRGTVSLGATASDGGSGVQSVVIERSPAGAGTWTAVCTDTTSPYSCSLDTTAGATPDGLYDFRARATDNASNSATSTTVTNRRIDNTGPTGVTMTDPGSPISGTKAFSGAATDSGSGMASVRFQYRPSSGGLWLDLCTDASSPYGCSFDTTTITDNQYDFQALATDNAGNTTTSTVYSSRLVDNTPPTVTMNDPGAYLRGTSVSLTASAADGGGIANVVIQRRPNGGSTWTTVCTDTTSPYSCSLDSTAGATPDGLYDFQAIATDNASRATTSNVVLARRIDNTAPTSVTITNPGASISGTKTLTGTGTDSGSGIQSIALQYSPTGQNTWTTACSGTTSPTNCNFDTTTISDGVYDFRTLATDNAGNQTASATASPNSRIDNYFPTVTMVDPGPAVHGTVTFSATASDGGGIANVLFQYKTSAGSTWTSLCTADTTFPYSCTVDTSAGSGSYDFRAIATDNAGKQTTSAVVTTILDSTAPTGVTFTNPGSPLSGTVSFSAAASDGTGSGIATVDIQYLNGATWTTICTDTTSPYSCSADTTLIADGSYSMRSLATDVAGNQTASTVVTNRVIDNTAPAVTMTDPGTWIGGVKTLGATASDAGSGVANVKIQYKLTAGSTWTDVCTDASSPYTCSLDTSTLTNGSQYDFRAIATDNATRSTTSAVVGPRTVDNGAPTISFTAPASPLRGSISFTSTPADSLSGVASVVYQYKLTSGSTWSTACTGSTSPWGCSWNSTAVSDESYDLRATVTDNAGNQTTSSVFTPRIVDNNQTPTGTDIQATDGGGNSGKMQVGDTVTFTFSEPVAPASVLSGWNGTSTSVVVRVDNFSNADRMSIWNGTDTTITNLTTNSATAGIQLFDNFSGSGVKWNATMVQSGTTITITFTSIRSGGIPPQSAAAHTMQWPVASGMTDLAGNPLATGTVAESGASDVDF